MKRSYRKDLCEEVRAFVIAFECEHHCLPTRAQIGAMRGLKYRQVCYAIDALEACGDLAPLPRANRREVCIVPGCGAPVHVCRGGQRLARCNRHQRAWWRQASRRVTRPSWAEQKRSRFRAVLRRQGLA